jgi:replicative DNA helicase
VNNLDSLLMSHHHNSTDSTTHHLLPSAVGVEKSVLGLLLSRSPLSTYTPLLAAGIGVDAFTYPAHKLIWEEIVGAITTPVPHDCISITQSLAHCIDEVGGAHYLTEMVLDAGMVTQLPRYIEQLREVVTRRDIIATATAILSMEREKTPTALLLEEMGERVSKIPPLVVEQTHRITFMEAMEQALNQIESGEATRADILSGIEGLDEVVKMQAGNLVVIGGAAKGGKTSLALSILRDAMTTQEKNCLMVSLEMSPVEIAARLLSMESKIPSSSMTPKAMTTGEYTRLANASMTLGRASGRLAVVSDLFSVDQITAFIKASHKRTPLDLVIIDYVQLIDAEQAKNSTRQEAVAGVSRALKRLAAELNIVVIALSQLNDNGELRESRSLGMDANIVLKIIVDKASQEREILVEMQRSGSSNVFAPCEYIAELTLFKSRDENSPPMSERAGSGFTKKMMARMTPSDLGELLGEIPTEPPPT